MEISQFVKLFALQFEDSEMSNIDTTTEFKKLETWDSLTAFSVQSMIEDELKINITTEELKSSKTVLDLFQLIQSK
ncbi:phosphopantetheine-binding protein [Pedobacter aquatilis]|uniref:phosphopantetheine-binding protein n=1 Tax=Pedobacter aquatilis TaxID=351343 RepID=UPI00292EF6B8|nr:phosphopantetheine-binding protein [Pedobacter aquatilis]